jgi:hypothetical protein
MYTAVEFYGKLFFFFLSFKVVVVVEDVRVFPVFFQMMTTIKKK